MQIILVLIAIFLGLLYNYNFTGFKFNGYICLLAGLSMVMPSLFKIKLNDLKIITTHKMIVAKNIFANFFILPIIALIIGFLSGDFGIAAGLFLLSVLAGGGMVMHWIDNSKANAKVGFILFSINILLVSFSFLMFNKFGTYFSIFYELENYSGTPSGLWIWAFTYLIVIPFVTSRILLFTLPSIPKLILKHRTLISNISIFLIIFYLFALKNTAQIYTIDTTLYIKSFIAVVLFYGLSFGVAKLIYNTKNEEQRAAFWHLITRYITLALVISTFSIGSYGVTLILPIMMAYFIQVPLAIYYSKSYNK